MLGPASRCDQAIHAILQEQFTRPSGTLHGPTGCSTKPINDMWQKQTLDAHTTT
eukprot:m.93581 g.93581  ORF g.93581 m.93581 type:complete len:54 (-) comp13002_c0_seq4:69-230(-)